MLMGADCSKERQEAAYKPEASSTDYVRHLPPTPLHHPPPAAAAGGKALLFIVASSSLSGRAPQVRTPLLPPHKHSCLTCEGEGWHSRIAVRQGNGSGAGLPAHQQAEG